MRGHLKHSFLRSLLYSVLHSIEYASMSAKRKSQQQISIKDAFFGVPKKKKLDSNGSNEASVIEKTLNSNENRLVILIFKH